MNNNQRNENEELKAAEQTVRILETGEFETARFETAEENQTLELGRLLRQSAQYDLPQSSDQMRQRLLEELESDQVPVEPTKSLLEKDEYQVSRKRMWVGLAAGAMLVVGGSFMYSSWAVSMAQRNHKPEVEELLVRAEVAEQQIALKNAKSEFGDDDIFSVQGEAVDPAKQLSSLANMSSTLSEEAPVADHAYGEVANEELNPISEPAVKFNQVESSAARKDLNSRKGVVLEAGSGKSRSVKVTNDYDGLQLQQGGQQQGQQGGQQQGQQGGLQQGQQGGQQLGQLAGEQKLNTFLMRNGAQQGQQSQLSGQQQESTRLYALNGGRPNVDDRFELKNPSSIDARISPRFGVSPSPQPQKQLRFNKDHSIAEPKSTKTESSVDVPDGGTVLMGGVKRKRKLGRGYKSAATRYRVPGVRESGLSVDSLDFEFVEEEKYSEQLGVDRDFGGEQYVPIHENQFIHATGQAAVSTFSVDVDTASYANMRRFLSSGQRPPRDSVRIEELVNYFQYNYPQPKGEDPFSVNLEMATCPWNDAHKLLRVGLKGKEIHVDERPSTNVVYLIDVSGSMNSQNKLPLLKRGFQMMTKQLGENDRVTIVTYAGNAGVALEPTTGENTKVICEAIDRLSPGGSTHGSAGIELAYKLAQQHFIEGGVNKVILATDGDLNVGVTDDDSLVKLIKQKASEGVFLTVLGFGTGNLKDGKLEKLADNGNGHYAYIDSNREAHRVLVQQMSGSLVTIAKDVKIQIEFNPAEVRSYRLIGYENRMMANKDFDNDRKDAGEIGAGHTVTAIYEIEPTGGVAEALAIPSGMKYQTAGKKEPAKEAENPRLTEAAASGELATVALRYKKPDENNSKRIEFSIKNEERSFGSASEDFRFATSVAGFGMLLRGSEHAGSANFEGLLEMASESVGDDQSGYRAEFVDLIRKACYGQ